MILLGFAFGDEGLHHLHDIGGQGHGHVQLAAGLERIRQVLDGVRLLTEPRDIE